MSYLTRALANTRRRSDLISLNSGKADPTMLLGNANMMGFMADLGKRELLTQHQEQLQHYTGYTYALIRTGTNAIAGQPVHVGRFKKQQKGRKGLPGQRNFAKHLVPKSLQPMSDDAEIIEDHPFTKCLHRPNKLPAMGKFALIQISFAALELCGITYWWIRLKKDYPDELEQDEIWPIPPSWIEPIHIIEDDYKRMFAAYRITPTGYAVPVIVPGNEIVQFYYPDPANPARPLSPIQALARTVFVDESIEESQRRHFLNSHNPGLAVIVGKMPGTEGIAAASPPVLTKHQRAQLVDALNEEWRAAVNYNNPIILDGLITDVKKISNTIQEMDYMNSSDSAKKRLSECEGISPYILGAMESANRATASVAQDHFYGIWTNPRITMFSEVLTQRVAPMFDEDDEGLVAWIELCKATDIDYELVRDTAMLDRDCMTRNEWRKNHHMDPLPDGDMTLSEWRTRQGFTTDPSISVRDQEDIMPDSMDEFDDEGNPKPNAKPKPLSIEGPKDEEDKPKEEATDEKIAKFARQARHHHPAYKSWHQILGMAEHVKVVSKRVLSVEKDFAKAMKSFYQVMGARVATSLASHTQPGNILTPGAVDTAISDSEWHGPLKTIVSEYLHRSAMVSALIEWEMHQPRKDGVAPKGGYGVLVTKTFWESVKKLPQLIRQAVSARVAKLVEKLDLGKIVESVRNKVKAVITDWVPGSGTVMDKIQSEVFSQKATQEAAETTASIQVNSGANAGADATRKTLGKLGLVNSKQWVTMRDSHVRKTHHDADGQVVGLDEKFLIGGVQCDYPGDLTLPADELFGCRCFAMSVRR